MNIDQTGECVGVIAAAKYTHPKASAGKPILVAPFPRFVLGRLELPKAGCTNSGFPIIILPESPFIDEVYCFVGLGDLVSFSLLLSRRKRLENTEAA